MCRRHLAHCRRYQARCRLTIHSSRNRFAVRLNSGVMHVETVALSSYSRFLKSVIVGGIIFFFALAAMSIWLAATDSPTQTARVIFIAMAAGFVGFAWFGLRLVPFLHVSCAATPDGLYIFDQHLQETFLPWKIGRAACRD